MNDYAEATVRARTGHPVDGKVYDLRALTRRAEQQEDRIAELSLRVGELETELGRLREMLSAVGVFAAFESAQSEARVMSR